jgi:hypothetical protein
LLRLRQEFVEDESLICPKNSIITSTLTNTVFISRKEKKRKEREKKKKKKKEKRKNHRHEETRTALCLRTQFLFVGQRRAGPDDPSPDELPSS